MAHYGQQIEEDVNPNDEKIFHYNNIKEKIYQYIDEYFDHPTMIKIKNTQKHSCYMRKSQGGLGKEHRYLVAWVIEDNAPIKNQEDLSNLRWVSFQTKTLIENHDITPHKYQPKKEGPLSVKIERTEMTRDYSMYKCEEFPLTIKLDQPTKGESNYQPRGNIIFALETYHTNIQWIPIPH